MTNSQQVHSTAKFVNVSLVKVKRAVDVRVIDIIKDVAITLSNISPAMTTLHAKLSTRRPQVQKVLQIMSGKVQMYELSNLQNIRVSLTLVPRGGSAEKMPDSDVTNENVTSL